MKRPNRFVLIAGLAVCLTLPALMLWKSIAVRGGLQELKGNGYSISRHVQYGFTLQNETNRLVEKAELRVRAPVKRTATQRCERLQASHPYELIVDETGNQTLCFNFNDLAPYATKIVRIESTLLLSDVPNPIPVQSPDAHLKPETFIESDDPAIRRLAQSLEAATPLATAQSIFGWVAENIRYGGYLARDRGALHVLRSRQGDCSEFAYLFAACCRASGIPARVLGGYICTEDSILKPAGYHNWAELYVNGAWRVADPQRKVFMKDASQFVAMQVMGELPEKVVEGFHRFQFKGEGIKVSMMQ